MIDASALLSAARELSFPRAAGSAGEPQIRRRLRERLETLGLEVQERQFDYDIEQPLARLRLGLHGLSIALGVTAVGAKIFPLPALLVGLSIVLWSAFELNAGLRSDETFGFDSGGGKSSANLSARFGSGSKRVVLVAHHDSKSQNLSFVGRAAAVLIAVVGALSLPAAFADSTGALLALPLAGAIALRFLARISFENESPGALDNAASMAVVLAATERLLADPPAETEIVVLFTAGEEDLMAGARVQARDIGSNWSDPSTLILNHDGVGAAGPIGLVGPAALRRRARAVAAAQQLATRSIWLPLGTGTDAMPLQRAGMQVLTLSSSRLDRAVRAIHTARDLPENLDSSALVASARLTEALARAHATRG